MKRGDVFRTRSKRANRAATMRILARAGRDNEPVSGDELPDDLKDARNTKEKQLPASGKRRGRLSSRTKSSRLA
jgi:hypothetical protein